jgi:hypothetical protein
MEVSWSYKGQAPAVIDGNRSMIDEILRGLAPRRHDPVGTGQIVDVEVAALPGSAETTLVRILESAGPDELTSTRDWKIVFLCPDGTSLGLWVDWSMDPDHASCTVSPAHELCSAPGDDPLFAAWRLDPDAAFVPSTSAHELKHFVSLGVGI